MPKHVLVALPLSDAQRSALQASVPEYEFIFAQTETVTLAQVLEADIIMGNVPVELICQNTIWNGSNPTLRDRIPIWCRACCRSSAW